MHNSASIKLMNMNIVLHEVFLMCLCMAADTSAAEKAPEHYWANGGLGGGRAR